MQDQTRACSLSLDDINVGLNSRQKEKTSSDIKRQRKDGEGKGMALETTPELESPVIENLHNRLLLTPIRWQSRSDSAAAAAAAASYRRDSAPATLLMKEDAISRRCSNPALLETIEEGQVSCRRKSTPAVMIQGSSAGQRLRGGLLLSPRRTLNTIHSSTPMAPVRRRSMPEITTTHKGTVTLETFYPPPRRNSLVTCSLAEVATRFELLNTRSQVPEESEMLERSRGGFDRNNGSGVPPSSHSLPPITL
ncbi:uncharacterized protein LOC117288883 [Asterias rubens]|uniref:uncharacterized protein LOC117288883 n=1 Tax=Asterias rubens TaxID=7604 RepID=UPI001455C6DA|nr:uncharacterized protein LOC117288883 [Asterias rubens]